MRRLGDFASVFLRLALAAAFLSAVADRLGFWGPFGAPNVAWGDFGRFVAYTSRLNWFLPPALVPTLAVIATVLETLFGVLLLAGWSTRVTAFLSGVLLTLFALAMSFSVGVKAPLNDSVFSAAAGAFLLASCASYPWSVDAWLHRRARTQLTPDIASNT